MSAHINIHKADPSAVRMLSRELGMPCFITSVLAARGIDTLQKAQEFLSPSLERDWHNPYDIAGMAELVDALAAAVSSDKRILVFGDFDLDGISATTIMTRGLRALHTEVIPFIPKRFEEGYGLTEAAIARVLTYEPDVVITVDNGIAAKREVKLLQEAGVAVLITDHHEPSGLVPEGVPLVDPKCDHCPSSILAGAGVALKVIQAVGARFGLPNLWRSLVDLATLGTVADLMPIVDENRALVAEGVRMLNENPRPSVAALTLQAGYTDRQLTSSNLSFSLVPRLNAAGRMGNAQLALDLLMEDDVARATTLAAELEQTNSNRRAIEAELAEVALAQAEEVFDQDKRVLVVAGVGWHEGVKGIVASRLTNKYGVPSILFTIDGDEARGSGRSVGSVNLFAAVESCSDLLTRFGGHEAAVGVTLPAANLPAFFDRLDAHMHQLPAEEFRPRIEVDATVDFSELSLINVSMLDRLAPFGQENPTPRFLAHAVSIVQGRAVGVDKNHLSCSLTDGSGTLNCIMFHCPDVNGLLECSSVVDAVFTLQVDEWRGRRSVKAVVSDMEPVEPCGALEACLDAEEVAFVNDLIDAERRILETPDAEREVSGRDRLQLRVQWTEVAKGDPALLRQALLRSFIGDGHLHDAQERTLAALSDGTSVLSVMGTGRGKSLVFQIRAVEVALAKQQASVFVYPLRALVADQAYRLGTRLADFGITVRILSGESDAQQRRQVMEGIEAGTVDIVLTTPEFLDCHLDEFSQLGRIGFVVIDEAHHVGTSKAGFRPSYRRLGQIVEGMGSPQVLACTATAGQGIADGILADLGITTVVTDETARGNLVVDDQRNIRKRERYLVNLVTAGEKTIVYVNSRAESISLARALRKQVPQVASLIGFYNAGLTDEERTRIEGLFRDDDIQVLVATSAFGEGIDIPGVRHVVLYHLPFSEVEFNQMSGRAGRDGQDATIHLLFGRHDGKLNRSILEQAAPDHDTMGRIYRQLRAIQRSQSQGFFPLSPTQLAQQASSILPPFEVSPQQVELAVSVFEELGLMEVHSSANEGEDSLVHVVDYKGKVELTDSVRYREGLDEVESFASFLEWVMGHSAGLLEDHIRKPLLP